ncbi:hypothetical protein CSUI_007008 [Cystoisospora suis]|uniref:Uncharacterized protein n=1 Tax=Cystoisospora suis TaxID=483139 RepID=A0A2C6JXC5_9APIC|nr:hypothetical protein CSUI_007008 [Cystoisospora suis]
MAFAESDGMVDAANETRMKVWKKMAKGPIKVTSSRFHNAVIWRGYEAIKRQLNDFIFWLGHRKTLTLTEAWFEHILQHLSRPSHPGLTEDSLRSEDDLAFEERSADVNKFAKRAMRQIFRKAVLEAAELWLPRGFEHMTWRLNEKTYNRMRPAVERIFYAGLAALYEVQLAQSASGTAGKNFRYLIETSPCPFSAYTSFGFVAEILQGATPQEAADAYRQEVGRVFNKYASPECELFKKSMEARFSKDASSFGDALSQVATAVRGRSFYEMASLVEAAQKSSPGMGEARSREERSRLSHVVREENRKRSRSPAHQKGEVIQAAVVEKVRVKAASKEGPDFESMVRKTKAKVNNQLAFSLEDLVKQSSARGTETV